MLLGGFTDKRGSGYVLWKQSSWRIVGAPEPTDAWLGAWKLLASRSGGGNPRPPCQARAAAWALRPRFAETHKPYSPWPAAPTSITGRCPPPWGAPSVLPRGLGHCPSRTKPALRGAGSQPPVTPSVPPANVVRFIFLMAALGGGRCFHKCTSARPLPLQTPHGVPSRPWVEAPAACARAVPGRPPRPGFDRHRPSVLL